MSNWKEITELSNWTNLDNLSNWEETVNLSNWKDQEKTDGAIERQKGNLRLLYRAGYVRR